MRVLDRLTAAVAALALVLAGPGAPPHPDARPVGTPVTTPERPVPPSGDPRATAVRHTPGHAPSELRTEFSGPGGDHRAGVAPGDGPDDLLPVAPARGGGVTGWAVTAARYRSPAVPSPPLSRLTRAPPTGV